MDFSILFSVSLPVLAAISCADIDLDSSYSAARRAFYIAHIICHRGFHLHFSIGLVSVSQSVGEGREGFRTAQYIALQDFSSILRSVFGIFVCTDIDSIISLVLYLCSILVQ